MSLQNAVSIMPWLDHLHVPCLWLSISSQLNAYAILLLQKDRFKISVVILYACHTLCPCHVCRHTEVLHMKSVCRRLACHLRGLPNRTGTSKCSGNYRLFLFVWKGDEIIVIWTGKFYSVSENLALSNLGMAECKLLATIGVYPVWRLSDCYYSRALKRARESESDSKKKSIIFFASKWSLIKVLSREVSQKVPFLSLWKRHGAVLHGQSAVPSFHLICMLERIR